MKKLTLPTGGSLATTLALMLLLIVAACENDDPQPSNPIIVANAGVDLSVGTGETVQLNAAKNSHLKDVNFNWQFITKPDDSQATLANADKPTASFIADVPGRYALQLTVSKAQRIEHDSINVMAYSVKSLSGTYAMISAANGGISKLKVYKNKLIAIGGFTEIGGIKAHGIAVFDGNHWSPMGSGLHDGWISDIIEYQDELYISGRFSGLGGVESTAIIRWDGNSWNQVPGLDNDTLIVDLPYPIEFINSGNSMAVFGGELYIGGSFIINPSTRVIASILQWDGVQLLPVTSPPGDFPILSGLKTHNKHLYALNRDHITFFDGSAWTNLDLSDLHISAASNNFVRFNNMISFQGMLLFELLYFEYQGTNDFFDEVYDVVRSELITWDGTQFSDFPAFSLKEGNLIHTIEEINNTLYLGGTFNGEVLGTRSQGIITWDGQLWGVVRDGPEASIRAIQQFQNNLFVAGSFNGLENHQIAIWQPLD